MGQVFGRCADRADFEQGESPDGDKSFERLAEARQNFPLGAAFVIDATAAARTAWRLDPESVDSQAVATTLQRVPSQKADSDR